MKTVALVLAWLGMAMTVVYLLLNPAHGLAYSHPGVTGALALIGVGIALGTHRKMSGAADHKNG